MMTEAIIVMMNMRGGCATVGGKVHTLFRVSNRRSAAAATEAKDGSVETERAVTSTPSASV